MRKLGILFVADGFKPFVAAALTRDGNCDVGKPAVFFSAVPMFYISGDHYHFSGGQADRLFPFFLIPSFPCRTDKKLSAVFCRMMNMPIVAARRFKGYVGYMKAAVAAGKRI